MSETRIVAKIKPVIGHGDGAVDFRLYKEEDDSPIMIRGGVNRDGEFYHAGQVCSSVGWVMIDAYDHFKEELTKLFPEGYYIRFEFIDDKPEIEFVEVCSTGVYQPSEETFSLCGNGQPCFSISKSALERYNEPITVDALSEFGFEHRHGYRYFLPDGEYTHAYYMKQLEGDEWGIALNVQGNPIVKFCKTIGQLNNFVFGISDNFLF